MKMKILKWVDVKAGKYVTRNEKVIHKDTTDLG